MTEPSNHLGTDPAAEPVDDQIHAGDLSLVPVLAVFADAGWEANHLTRPGGVMRCGKCAVETRASELDAVTVHRIEGASDPDDMQMVLGIECPDCAAKGALVVGYGPTATEQDADFLIDLGIGEAVEMLSEQ